ncbi:MAG: L-2-amino-thiazoline-4-carboxylic acid hydrolase [Clostridia bacterium]|nr:L-2-amino-thiazoline-4-carboxylic acid hydrolase [Clostridia bacterium]
MKQYTPEKLVAISRYCRYVPTLPAAMQSDIFARIRELTGEEKRYCDQGNYKHMAQIFTAIALYQTLQKHGRSEKEAFRITSEEMWRALTPKAFQKMARLPFFLPLMKKILPFGFRHGSGTGWRYEWHLDDPKDRFHFECRECVYRHIFEEQGLMKLGAMFCHADIINYGELPYTDFRRTKTLCQGGDCCDFDFVRHRTDAGDGWERTESI